jgi:esterase/lipase superfamily enzyme
MVEVLFATNRQLLTTPAGAIAAFGADPLPPSANSLFCASATVADIDISKPQHGRITAIAPLNQGGFTDEQLAPILASTNDILVFVHGAANSFSDAITRAAYNQTWLAAAQLPNGNFDIIAFTWPSTKYHYPNLLGDLIDYLKDRERASQSAYHFDLFLRQISAFRQRVRNRRVNLLCHSMGNYMLGGATELWFSAGAAPATPLFDEIVLAAADETATSFSTPNHGRLADLWRLGREITVYYNNDDVLMHLSRVVNQDYRLGWNGPPNAADKHFFSPNVYEFVDCTGIDDFISGLIAEPDRSHQYYRQSPRVRADIATTLAGGTPVGRRYDAASNTYSLFA